MKTVLVIDDDPDFGTLMSEVLTRHGWQVFTANEGDAGIDLARRHRPGIVLCDLLMPRCNGFRVCRELRGDTAMRHTRIVVTSGRNFEADRQAAFDAGADEYLPKPVEPSRLLSLLARLNSPAAATDGAAARAVIKPGPATLRFWGVRGSTPAPGPGTVQYGGNTSCVEVRAEGEIIILDAGTGLRLLGRELMEEFKDQSLRLTLLLTHTHWDHIQGLPFFRPLYESQNRLRILGYEGARHGLGKVLSSQMENPFFPVAMREVPANVEIEELKEMSFHVGKVRVEACFANHPGICVGYRLFTSEGSFAFFPDNEPHYGAHLSTPGSGTRGPAEYAQTLEARTIEFLRGTDVLIMDSQYDREEYQRHVGWGHACVDDAVALALKSGVKKLFLFHHDPDHDDAKISQMADYARKLVAAQKGKMEVEAAREGAAVRLG